MEYGVRSLHVYTEFLQKTFQILYERVWARRVSCVLVVVLGFIG